MFTVTMTTDGAAFDDPQAEIGRILAKLTGTVNDSAADWSALVAPFGVSGPLHDANGNRVGTWAYEPANAVCGRCGQELFDTPDGLRASPNARNTVGTCYNGLAHPEPA